MKVYEVLVTDIWNNIYQLGYYKDLNDSIEDINEFIYEDEFKLQTNDLKEYDSTFGSCFDVSLYDIIFNRLNDEDLESNSEDLNLMVRGFILDTEDVIEQMKKLEEVK